MDPWPWKTGLGQGFLILEFRIWIELILDFGLRPSEIGPPCGILPRGFRRAEFHRAGIAETMRCWVERKRRKLVSASSRHERCGAIESRILAGWAYFLVKFNEGRQMHQEVKTE